MNCLSILVLKTLFDLTASQVSITVVTNTVNTGDSVVLTCTVPNFNDNIFVIQNISTNRAVCTANDPCTSTAPSLYTATKTGTDTVLFTILSFLKTRDEGSWFVRYGSNTDSTPIILSEKTSSPTSELNTYTATHRTTSVNSNFELNNITIAISTGSITPTSEISASTKSFLNTGNINTNAHTDATNVYLNTETTLFYTQTETFTSQLNTENANLNANTETYIHTITARIESISMSIYQSMFVTTPANDMSGSLDSTNQKNYETFTLLGYSISSYNEILLPSTFETRNIVLETLTETSMFLSGDTLSNNLLNTLHVSSWSLITTDSSEYSILSLTIAQSYVGDSYTASLRTFFSVPILTSESTDSDFKITNESAVQTPITTATIDSSAINTIERDSLEDSSLGYTSRIQQIITNTESPLMPSKFIDHISLSSKMEDQSFSSHQYLSEPSVTLPTISVSNHFPSAIINTMNHFLYTTNTVMTSYLDDTRHSVDDFTDGYQTFSQDYAASTATSLTILFNSTDHHYLSLQTTEYNETMQTEFTPFVSKPLCESQTDSDAPVIYSKEKVTSGSSYIHTSVMPSETQLSSTNNIQDSTTDFKPYFQSNDNVFASESSDDLLSASPSTSLLLQFKTKTNDSELGSYMKPTNMSTFEFQSGMLTYTHPSSIQISTGLLDFKTTLLTATINVNSKIMPTKIKSSKQTNNGISYNEIETSFTDSLFPFDSVSGSLTSNDKDITSLSSGVYKSISTMSTNIKQSGLSEKNKTIIFISTSSAVIAVIVVILLIIFAKVYKSKFNNIPPKVDDKTSWSNNSIPPKKAFSDFSFTGKNIHPLLNTSSLSLKMFHYEQHWNDLV